MAEELYFGAPNYAGVWHRFRTLNHVAGYVRHFRCPATFLWGISDGVSHCRFEELFSPIPGFKVLNLTAAEIDALEAEYSSSSEVKLHGRRLKVYRGGLPKERTLVYDLPATFESSTLLRSCTPANPQGARPVAALPSPKLAQEAAEHIRRWDITRRLGIRVRVTECPIDGRPLGRVQKALDQAIRSIIRLPWHVRVFLVTDSEYVQQILASHFRDIRFLKKSFSSRETAGAYIDRKDPAAMRAFVIEIACLSACTRIIDFGGFLNRETLEDKILHPPFSLESLGQGASGLRSTSPA